MLKYKDKTVTDIRYNSLKVISLGIGSDIKKNILTAFDELQNNPYWFTGTATDDIIWTYNGSTKYTVTPDSDGSFQVLKSDYDTTNVTSMVKMFYNCSGLTSLDLSNFDTTNVTSMASMFSGCSGLTSLDLSNFDTTNVTSMSYMFYGCSKLTSLDLSNFDTSLVINMLDMFEGCSSSLYYIKCKQAFKDWCETNQDTLKIIFYNIDWDIVD